MKITLHSQLFGTLELDLYESNEDERAGRITGRVEIPQTEINGIPVSGHQWFSAYTASVYDGNTKIGDQQEPLRQDTCRIKRCDNGDDLTANQRSKVYNDLEKALENALAEIPDFNKEWEISRTYQRIAKRQQIIASKQEEIAKMEKEIKELEALLS